MFSRLIQIRNQLHQIRMSRWLRDDLGKNKKRQQYFLYKNISYAVNNIEYYKNWAIKNNYKFSYMTIFEDIKNFPIINKEIIRNNYESLINKKLLKKSFVTTSGGTTGELVKIHLMKKLVEKMGAITKIQYEWAGKRDGDLLVQLWGNEKELIEKGLKSSGILELSEKVFILNSFLMDDERMERYRQFINKKKPVLILAYSQSIHEFSLFLKKVKRHIHKPKSIMVTASVLQDFQKKHIEEVFGCPIFNRYGSREVANIACDCVKHNGLHVDTFFHYLEILDKNFNSVSNDGESGEVYITLFNNWVMPIIRYKMGDLAVYSDKVCDCGVGTPLIHKVIGRTVDIFKTKSGGLVDGEYFTHLFYFMEGLDQFQIIQEELDLLKINLVSKDCNFLLNSNLDLKRIEKKIKLVMGEDCIVEYYLKDKIDIPVSGKKRFTISKI